jgi:hypothetical protein
MLAGKIGGGYPSPSVNLQIACGAWMALKSLLFHGWRNIGFLQINLQDVIPSHPGLAGSLSRCWGWHGGNPSGQERCKYDARVVFEAMRLPHENQLEARRKSLSGNTFYGASNLWGTMAGGAGQAHPLSHPPTPFAVGPGGDDPLNAIPAILKNDPLQHSGDCILSWCDTMEKSEEYWCRIGRV